MYSKNCVICDNNSSKLYLTRYLYCHSYTLLYCSMSALYIMFNIYLTCILCLHLSTCSTARNCEHHRILEKLFNAFEDGDLGKVCLLYNALMNGRNGRNRKCFKLIRCFVDLFLTFRILLKIIFWQCFGIFELGTIIENFFR